MIRNFENFKNIFTVKKFVLISTNITCALNGPHKLLL